MSDVGEAPGATTPIEAAALAAIVRSADARIRDGLGLELHDVDDAVVAVAARVANPLFNRAVGVRAEIECLERVCDVFRRAGVAQFFVQASEDVADAVEALAPAVGLERYRRAWARMARLGRERPAGAEDPRVRAVAPEDAARVTEILATCFDLPAKAAESFVSVLGAPGWSGFVGCDGDRVVAAGLVFCRGREAYLAAGATLREARGRGLQQALLARRIAHALDQGCDVVTSETGEEVEGQPQTSYRNLARAGLTQRGRWVNFVPAAIRAAPARPLLPPTA